MNIFQVLILSIVEGLTEFLPISSTGHLILAQHYLQISTTEFSKSFDIIIQLASILAVVWFYRTKIINARYLFKSTFIAFLPTGILGLVFYKFIKNFLLGNILVTVFSLLVGGIVLLIADYLPKLNKGEQKTKELSILQLLKIGLFQSISMVPGVSRSAASIVGGLSVGLSRIDAVEFSFLLAIPTMLAASGYDLLKTGLHFNQQEYLLLGIGCLVTFLTSLFAIKIFINLISKYRFTPFAIYRIILALVILLSLR